MYLYTATFRRRGLEVVDVDHRVSPLTLQDANRRYMIPLPPRLRMGSNRIEHESLKTLELSANRDVFYVVLTQWGCGL